MKQKNRYIVGARITEGVFREFLRLFALDLEAVKIAKITGLNGNGHHGNGSASVFQSAAAVTASSRHSRAPQGQTIWSHAREKVLVHSGGLRSTVSVHIRTAIV